MKPVEDRSFWRTADKFFNSNGCLVRFCIAVNALAFAFAIIQDPVLIVWLVWPDVGSAMLPITCGAGGSALLARYALMSSRDRRNRADQVGEGNRRLK